ncbi:MAG: glutamyl-tRNA reductase [Candidatus Schekmanbacteria bacterium]|nr:glutamyl-tRNA reductase [Candidatus Schekmanbacteria bacterium]
MELIAVGLNHETSPIEVRERFAFSPEQALEAMSSMRAELGVREIAILSTCNRSEVYSVGPRGTELAPRIRTAVCRYHGVDHEATSSCFYVHQHAAVARHLLRVASSLDSLVVGEPHILGQIRDAFQLALAQQYTGTVLNRLFHLAVHAGKRVRTETEIGLRPVSVSSVGVDLAQSIFGDLRDCSVIVIGAGEIGQATVRSLTQRGAGRITVANRSIERARELARELGGRALDLEAGFADLRFQDIVITSAAADRPLLDHARIADVMAAREDRPLFFIDLALPRNVDHEVSTLYNVFLYNLDDLQGIAAENRKERERDLPRVQAIVDEHVTAFMQWYEGLAVVPTIKELRRRAARISEDELQEHLRRLGDLTERDREIVRSLAHAITNKLLHEPTVRLRESADPGHLASVRYLFDLESGE